MIIFLAYVSIILGSDFMEKIKFSVFYSHNQINICAGFVDCLCYNIISLNIKVVDDNGAKYDLLCNKLLQITENFSVWNYQINAKKIKSPKIVIVEVCSSGKLICIKRFDLNLNKVSDEVLFYRNQDVCFRKEDNSTISLFNTNGNLIFAKGLYYELWNILERPMKKNNILENLIKKNYSEDRIITSLGELTKRNLILKINNTDITKI